MAPLRRNVLLAAATATVVIGMALGVWPASSGPEDEIKAVHSGKVISLAAAATTLGSPVVQRSSEGRTDQAWNVVELTRINGWPLVLIQSAETGLVLDVVGGFTGAGAPLVQNPWAGSASQLWLLLPYGNTGWEIILNIKSGRVADVAGASSDDGASIIQWDWRGGANQIWDVPDPEPLPTTTTSTSPATTSTSPTTSTSSTTTTTEPTTTTTEPPTTTTEPPTTTTTAGPLITLPTLLQTTTTQPTTTTTTESTPTG